MEKKLQEGLSATPRQHINFFLADLPKAFFNKKLVMLASRLKREYFAPNSLARDCASLRLLDGIVNVSCFEYLPDTKGVKQYKVKRVFREDEKMVQIKNPAIDGPMFKVYISLPKEIVLLAPDYLEVQYWNGEKWTQEGMGEIGKEYMKDHKKTFYVVSIPYMAPVALMSSRFAEVPYLDFKLRRISRGVVKFDLTTTRVSLSMEIRPFKIRLTQSSEDKLDFLLNKDFEPATLLHQLQKINVYLLPDHLISPKPKKVKVKDFTLAKNALLEISKACLYYHIKASQWNKQTNEGDLILRIRENPERDEEFHEDTAIDWQTIQFKSHSVKVLEILENSPKFSKKRKKDTVSHLNLYFLVNQYSDLFVQNYYDENFTKEEIQLITTTQNLLGMIQLFHFR